MQDKDCGNQFEDLFEMGEQFAEGVFYCTRLSDDRVFGARKILITDMSLFN